MKYWQTRISRAYTRELQDKLNFLLGTKLVLDGWYGANTMQAVLDFQYQYNLTEDGKCGTNTWGELNDIFYQTYEGYIKLRRYGSDVYLYLSKDKPVLEYGVAGKRERLSQMAFGYEWITNGEYFNFNDPSSKFIRNEHYLSYDGEKIVKGFQDDFICFGSYAVVMNGMMFNNDPMFNAYNFPNLYPYSHQPRTLVGNNKRRYVSFVADGRRWNSRGFNMTDMIAFARELACTNLLNLDGGGSTQVIYNGKTVNKPSDGSERPIGTSLGFKI